MTTQVQREERTQQLTIIRVYQPDPQRQLQALRFLLEAKSGGAHEPSAENSEARTSTAKTSARSGPGM